MDAQIHGQRSTYQHGCRCTPCKAANAAYIADLRSRRLRGRPILGVLVSAVAARRKVRQLVGEEYTKARIAEMAGWRSRQLQFERHRRIRLSTWLRIQRVATFAMLEGTL